MKTVDLYCPQCRAKLHDTGYDLRTKNQTFLGECGACHASFQVDAEVTVCYETSPFPARDFTPPIFLHVYPVLQRGDA